MQNATRRTLEATHTIHVRYVVANVYNGETREQIMDGIDDGDYDPRPTDDHEEPHLCSRNVYDGDTLVARLVVAEVFAEAEEEFYSVAAREH
jgi:hypothetical protein